MVSGSDPSQTRAFTDSKGVGPRYLEKVMQKLVRAGILKGVRGPGGGYHLARERRRISVGEIVRIAESAGGTAELELEEGSPLAVHVVQPLMREVHEAMMRELDGVSLEDLCHRAVARGLMQQTAEGFHAQFDI